MLSVFATKIKASRGDQMVQTTVGRNYEGYLLSAPIVGRNMVLFRDKSGRRMVTTPVRRVLGDSDKRVFYIETENSVYRLYIRDAELIAKSNCSPQICEA